MFTEKSICLFTYFYFRYQNKIYLFKIIYLSFRYLNSKEISPLFSKYFIRLYIVVFCYFWIHFVIYIWIHFVIYGSILIGIQANMYKLYIWYKLQLHVKRDKEIQISADKPRSTLTSLVWLQMGTEQMSSQNLVRYIVIFYQVQLQFDIGIAVFYYVQL